MGGTAHLEQLPLLADQRRALLQQLGIERRRLAGGLGVQPRRLRRLDLPAAGQLGELGLDQLAIEGHQRLAGGDRIAFGDVDARRSARRPDG